MTHVRIYGDPFGDGAEASQLRSFLRGATAGGLVCSLSLSGVAAREPARGERAIPLTDGARNWTVGTALPPAEVELILRAAENLVAATAPLVVFAPEEQLEDVQTQAGLEYRHAAAVIGVRPGVQASDLLSRLRGELRWAGNEDPPHALPWRTVQPWIELPDPTADGPLVHVADDPFTCGTDELVDAWLRHHAATGRRLRVVLPTATPAAVAAVRERVAAHEALVEVRTDGFTVDDVRDAAAVVLPMRTCAHSRWLVLALASGRPVCASRFAAVAEVLDGRGVVLAIGGRIVEHDARHGTYFAPHPASLRDAIDRALQEGAPSATGRRARAHVVAELVRGRPAGPPPAVPELGSSRATVVLEAPIFETSSTAELTIATAEALQRRGVVDLRIVPTAPFRHDLGWLRERAPSLLPTLCRAPGKADLWLSAGWPARASRPECRTWALRIDWEYGALPMELTPHATQEADLAIVHSEHVYRTMTSAGRPMASIKVVPHGVDPVMQEVAPPDQRVLDFKGKLPAVLFCGGLVWRKGFDVFLRTVLEARAQGREFVVVVKSVGGDQHYGRVHLGELLARFRRTPGTPPILVVEEDLSRAQMASLYTACDVLLHPYRGEGFCMPVLEARSCGLPVIATGGGATDPLMEGPGACKLPSARRSVELPGAHVSTPWVVEPDPEATTSEFVRVLDDIGAKRRAALGIASAVRSAFTWDAAAVSIEQLAIAGMARRSVVELGREPVVTLSPSPRPAALAPTAGPVGEPVAN